MSMAGLRQAGKSALTQLLLRVLPPILLPLSASVAKPAPVPAAQGIREVTPLLQPLRLASGEALRIQVPADSAAPLNGFYAIDLAGFADLPIVGRLQVGGRTPGEVETALSKSLGSRLRGTAPRVSGAVRLGFVGTWARPGDQFLPADASLWDALLAAGGPAPGSQGVAQIMRGSELLLQVNVLGDYTKQTTLRGVGIRSGDIFMLSPAFPPPQRTSWDVFKEGLSVTTQIMAVMGSLLSLWLTYDILRERNKL
jgi:hypothetical protein